MADSTDGTGTGRVVVVTGANQGLGFALVSGLRHRMPPPDVVYLTGRNPERVAAAAKSLADQGLAVVTEVLDVTDESSVERFATLLQDRHGGVDVVISNAAARITPGVPDAEQVRGFVETNNRGTNRLLGALVPLLQPGGRYLVVASSFGTLRSLDPALHGRFDRPGLGLADIDPTMDAYVDAVEHGREAAEGWPSWINIPSKVGQVAATRIVARHVREHGPDDAFVAAVCPGLVDTDASRPWFDNMDEAQSPDDAAAHIVRLALDPVDPAFYGELVQLGRILPWR